MFYRVTASTGAGRQQAAASRAARCSDAAVPAPLTYPSRLAAGEGQGPRRVRPHRAARKAAPRELEVTSLSRAGGHEARHRVRPLPRLANCANRRGRGRGPRLCTHRSISSPCLHTSSSRRVHRTTPIPPPAPRITRSFARGDRRIQRCSVIKHTHPRFKVTRTRSAAR